MKKKINDDCGPCDTNHNTTEKVTMTDIKIPKRLQKINIYDINDINVMSKIIGMNLWFILLFLKKNNRNSLSTT